MKRATVFLFLVLSVDLASGQKRKVEDLDQKYLNWFNKDIERDETMGASVDKLYDSVLVNTKPRKTVIVAVIDGGVDIYHEDLVGRIWINQDEIAKNKIDDDHNGYIDDVHGWNFLGNAQGENVYYENFEFTRIVRKKDKSDKNFQAAWTKYDTELKKRVIEQENIVQFEKKYNAAKTIIMQETGIEVKSLQDLYKVNSRSYNVLGAMEFLKIKYTQGFTEEDFDKMKKNNSEYLEYLLNEDYDSRTIVGDDPANFQDKNYGNNDVIGPRSEHGTSVAGIIAGVRNNNLGINGIATDVQIMSLRTTPKGDERDKDVALAIIYAVDNGADIINMSFGKEFSPQKEFVDQAIKYAEEHQVLIIHAAGNSGVNLDSSPSYPIDRCSDGTIVKNWLNVGASDMVLNKYIPAKFSNYGANDVDIFSPGVNMISLDRSSTYSMGNGTSIAAPVVTGIAALILSYYPDLTPEELIQLLLEGSHKITRPKKVLQPGLTAVKREKIEFTQLAKCGGVVNAYNTFLLARQRYK